MPASIIDIKHFTVIPGTGHGRFMHKIKKGRLENDPRIFYQKEMESKSIACLELLAQEFFRLIIPNQPETKLAWNSHLNTYFILSEEVTGYKLLPVNSSLSFSSGAYSGLGQVMILSIFLQEIDLKNGNICLNEKDQVIKIDGDWCFAAIRNPSFKEYKKDITTNLLLTLPFPFSYSAFNWLDIYINGVATLTSNIVDDNLATSSHFREEVNEAILKILLIPDEYISKFVDAYISISIHVNVFISYLKNRREELKLVALRDESFITYLKSSSAKKTLNQHLLHIKSFVVNSHYPIIDSSNFLYLEQEVNIIYENLCINVGINPRRLTDFAELNAININFNSKTTKPLMINHRDVLLKQIEHFIESLANRADNNHINYRELITLAEEKRRLTFNLSSHLEQRFDELEQLSFEEHLKLFIQKQQEMSIKSLSNINYKEAVKCARSFCIALERAQNNFLSLDKPLEQAKVELKKECLRAIKEARVVLENHREWKGTIKKFIMDILSWLSLGLSAQLGLFSKTDSGMKLDDLEQTLAKQIP